MQAENRFETTEEKNDDGGGKWKSRMEKMNDRFCFVFPIAFPCPSSFSFLITAFLFPFLLLPLLFIIIFILLLTVTSLSPSSD